MKKRLVISLTVLTLVGVGAALTPAVEVAQADTAGCVSKKEYRHVHRGDSIRRVHRIFDTRGRLQEKGTSGGYPAKLRIYKACRSAPYPAVAVAYKKKADGVWRLVAKSKVEVGE